MDSDFTNDEFVAMIVLPAKERGIPGEQTRDKVSLLPRAFSIPVSDAFAHTVIVSFFVSSIGGTSNIDCGIRYTGAGIWFSNSPPFSSPGDGDQNIGNNAARKYGFSRPLAASAVDKLKLCI